MPEARAALVVEDDASSRELVVTLLQYGGFHCQLARDAEEGRRQTEAQKPDLLVIDLDLGRGPDGIWLLKQVRARYGADTPAALAVTAYPEKYSRKAALAAGFAGYLVKPVDPSTFADEVRRLASSAKRHQPRA